jgi:hypothetical protein
MLMGRSVAGPGPWLARIERVLTAPGMREWVHTARRSARAPEVQHRLDLLDGISTDAAIEQSPIVAELRDELTRRVVRFRPQWNGRSVGSAEIQRRVRTDPGRARRRKAWAARHPLDRSLEARLRELVRRRNERARAFGFRNFYEWRSTREGFTIAQMEEYIDTLLPYARAANRQRRDRFRDLSGEEGWYPWDLRFSEALEAPLPDPSFAGRTMIPDVLEGIRRWGFGVAPLTFRIDRHELPSGGIELPIDPPGDVRVIVHPDAGWVRYMILFHEVGHAVQARSNARHSPLIRWHEFVAGFPGMIEGVGTLFEAIPRSPEWLVTRPGIDRAMAERFARVTALGSLSGLGWLIAKVLLEIELYRRPDGNLRVFQHRLERRIGGYDEYPPTPFADPFFIDHPVYLQNYVLAHLFARHLLTYLGEEYGPEIWPNPKIGPWLVDHWFRASGEYAWVPHVRETTGRRFGVAAHTAWSRTTLAASASVD